MSNRPEIKPQIDEIANHLFKGTYSRESLEENVVLGNVGLKNIGQEFFNDFEDLLVRSIDSSARHVRLNHNGVPLMLPNDTGVQHEFCCKKYAEGASIILNGIDDMCQRYADSCKSIEEIYVKRTVASMYLTPKNSRGFNPHFDMDDVIVLQVAGTKKWYFENLAIRSAIRRLASGVSARYEEQDAVVLTPGDWCFIPAGYVHHAKSFDETSLHMTFSMHSPRAYHFLEHALKRSIGHHILDAEVNFTMNDALSMISRVINDNSALETTNSYDRFIDELENERLSVRKKNPLINDV